MACLGSVWLDLPACFADCGCCCFAPDDSGNESTRPLGLVVIRGTHIMLLGPADGSLRIANPFLPSSDEDSGNYDADDDE